MANFRAKNWVLINAMPVHRGGIRNRIVFAATTATIGEGISKIGEANRGRALHRQVRAMNRVSGKMSARMTEAGEIERLNPREIDVAQTSSEMMSVGRVAEVVASMLRGALQAGWTMIAVRRSSRDTNRVTWLLATISRGNSTGVRKITALGLRGTSAAATTTGIVPCHASSLVAISLMGVLSVALRSHRQRGPVTSEIDRTIEERTSCDSRTRLFLIAPPYSRMVASHKRA